MKVKTVIFPLLLSLVLIPSALRAQTGSIGAAVGIVREFHTEKERLMKGVDGGAVFMEAKKRSDVMKERASNDLKAINWTETPGQKRFDRVYRLVESYTDGEISSLRGLVERSKGVERARMEEAVRKLTALRTAKLSELNEALKSETYEKKGIKPVPVIDVSPKGSTPGEEHGIWFR